MPYDFNADNVFEMAEIIEKNGAEFYWKAAKKVTDTEAKQLLLNLAEQELAHEKTFRELRAQLTGDEKESTLFDQENYAMAYLHALAITRVFFDKNDLPDEQPDTEGNSQFLKKILISAIRSEKDSIVFYVGIRDLVPETFGKSRVDEIIQEEMVHLTDLSRELATLTD
ncbi:MAG: ferritin family protein [Deltaproteobacteria bacterium]|nr:ferritin family protein [Deltaproteobacteria bacterium]